MCSVNLLHCHIDTNNAQLLKFLHLSPKHARIWVFRSHEHCILHFLLVLESEPNWYESDLTSSQAFRNLDDPKSSAMYGYANSQKLMHNPMNTNIKILLENCKKRGLANSRSK